MLMFLEKNSLSLSESFPVFTVLVFDFSSYDDKEGVELVDFFFFSSENF